MKEQINRINKMALTNWERAKGMLDMFNDIYDTKFDWLNKRVVFSDYPGTAEDNTAAFYANCHDAYTAMEED